MALNLPDTYLGSSARWTGRIKVRQVAPSALVWSVQPAAHAGSPGGLQGRRPSDGSCCAPLQAQRLQSTLPPPTPHTWPKHPGQPLLRCRQQSPLQPVKFRFAESVELCLLCRVDLLQEQTFGALQHALSAALPSLDRPVSASPSRFFPPSQLLSAPQSYLHALGQVLLYGSRREAIPGSSFVTT